MPSGSPTRTRKATTTSTNGTSSANSIATGRCRGAEEVIADGVAPGPGYVDLIDVGLAGPPQIGSELLEVGLPVLEVLADAADQGLSAAVGSCFSRRRMMTVGGACSSR
jgi:hypothetical protein